MNEIAIKLLPILLHRTRSRGYAGATGRSERIPMRLHSLHGSEGCLASIVEHHANTRELPVPEQWISARE